MHRRRRGHRRSVVAAVLLLSAACGSGDGGAADASTPLPDLTLVALDGGGDVEIAAPTDRPRVVNLWASWCAPCRQELPVFDDAATERADDVEVVGVNVGDDADTAAGVVEELDLTFEQLLDRDSELNAALQVTNMPSTLFVDPAGAVVEVHAGAMTADELDAAIDELVGA